MDVLLFYVFAAVAIGASLLVIGQRSPMYSVLLLIVSFGALAGLYVLLGAPFVAVTQIIIYAGAIMVLFLFVVMLLNAPREEAGDVGAIGSFSRLVTRRFGAALAVALGLELWWVLARTAESPLPAFGSPAPVSSVRAIGRVLFTDHVLAFEATSVLIIVALVGAVVLARREG